MSHVSKNSLADSGFVNTSENHLLCSVKDPKKFKRQRKLERERSLKYQANPQLLKEYLKEAVPLQHALKLLRKYANDKNELQFKFFILYII